ncbi:hypothetical protein FGW37_27980 [Streptomyces rectiverticillatus]|uniref:hypothetical protein n=1 Tax=Streptomyces rectiverticillatus TaxID=173860 RepID=UPI0015C352E7|nr:hypothetical protein [Streptomyces rectiverticillatus]QLE74920.1 hypothetical protein FGW37_27980 [Streptomyces rectiverticillatus]
MSDQEAEATEAPEPSGTLELADRDGILSLTLSGGEVIPKNIPVLDESGKLLAVYTAGPPTPPSAEAAPDVLAERTVVDLT